MIRGYQIGGLLKKNSSNRWWWTASIQTKKLLSRSKKRGRRRVVFEEIRRERKWFIIGSWSWRIDRNSKKRVWEFCCSERHFFFCNQRKKPEMFYERKMEHKMRLFIYKNQKLMKVMGAENTREWDMVITVLVCFVGAFAYVWLSMTTMCKFIIGQPKPN